jgi:hypothetical protein
MNHLFYHVDVNRLTNLDVLNRIHQIIFYFPVDFDLELGYFPIEVQSNDDLRELRLEPEAFLNVRLMRINFVIDKKRRRRSSTYSYCYRYLDVRRGVYIVVLKYLQVCCLMSSLM